MINSQVRGWTGVKVSPVESTLLLLQLQSEGREKEWKQGNSNFLSLKMVPTFAGGGGGGDTL